MSMELMQRHLEAELCLSGFYLGSIWTYISHLTPTVYLFCSLWQLAANFAIFALSVICHH